MALSGLDLLLSRFRLGKQYKEEQLIRDLQDTVKELVKIIKELDERITDLETP